MPVHPLLSPTRPGSSSQADSQRRFLRFASIYILVWLLTWYSASVLEAYGVTSLWYLPGGLRFSCLLLLGWAGLGLELATGVVLIALQALLGSWAPAGPPSPPLASLLYNLLAYPCAYALVVLPLRRHFTQGLDLARTADSAVFVAAALAASALAAAAGTGGLVYWGDIAAAQGPAVFFSWLIGDLIGVLTLAPLLLVWLGPALLRYLRQGRWGSSQGATSGIARQRVEWPVALIVLVSLLLVMGFPHLIGQADHSPLVALALLPPLAAVALRYQLRGAVLAAALLDAGLVLLVALFDHGALAAQYQLVMGAIALVGLWLGGTVEAGQRLILRLRDFASVSNDLLWEINPQGQVHFSGPLAEQLAVPSGAHWRTLLAPLEQPAMEQLEQALQQRKPFSRLEVALPQGTQTRRWLSVNGLPLWDAGGEFAGYRGTASDISDAVQVKVLLQGYNQMLLQEVAQRTAELHQKNAELSLKGQHLNLLLSTVPVGVLEFDAQGRCQYINANGAALCACSAEAAIGMHFMDFVHAEDRAQMATHWDLRAQFSTVQSLELRLHRSAIWCCAYWIQFRQDDAQADCTIMVLADVSLQHQHAAQLWTLAHTDLLTGLPNRSLFLDRCAQALTLARRRDTSLAIFWMDLDGFKAVNDSLGHAAGDVLLQQVAQRLRGRIRDSDTVARMGGDEFAVLISEVAHADAAQQLAGELVASLRKPFVLPQGSCEVSASLGIALYPAHATELETLLQYADSAMYSAKHAGKNRVHLWQPD